MYRATGCSDGTGGNGGTSRLPASGTDSTRPPRVCTCCVTHAALQVDYYRRQGREARKGSRGRWSRDRDMGDSVKAAAALKCF